MSIEELEEKKLLLEIKKLQQSWWKKTNFVSIIITALFSFAIIIISFRIGTLDEKSEQVKLKEQRIAQQINSLNNNKIKIDNKIKLYRDSIQDLTKINRRRLFHLIVKNEIINNLNDENINNYSRLKWILIDSNKTSNEIREIIGNLVSETYYNSDSCFELMMNKTLTYLTKEDFSLPKNIEIEVKKNNSKQDDLEIILRFYHRTFAIGLNTNKSFWEDEIFVAAETLKRTLKEIIKSNKAYVNRVVIKGNTDGNPFETRASYDGSLGVIENEKVTLIQKRDTTQVNITITPETQITNLELAVLRGFMMKKFLGKSNHIWNGDIELYAQVNEGRHSLEYRNVEIRVQLKNAYSRIFGGYYWDEDELKEIINRNFGNIQKKQSITYYN